MSDISRRLAEVGQALHGPQWKRPLARDLGVAESSIRDWLTGRRTPPEGLGDALTKLWRQGGNSPGFPRAPQITPCAQTIPRALRAHTLPAPSRALAIAPTPPPRSMVAIGGDPARVRGLIDPLASGRAEAMLRALAARSDAQRRQIADQALQIAAQGREIAAIRRAGEENAAQQEMMRRILEGVRSIGLWFFTGKASL
jgi:hypothetical protein